MTDSVPIWFPTPEQASTTQMARFLAHVRTAVRSAAGVTDVPSLYAWSVAHRGDFWPAVWDFCGVVGDGPGPAGVGLDRMAPPDPVLGPRWFPEARLNFAENLLREPDDRPAVVAWNEEGRHAAWSRAALAAEAAAFAAALRAAGVRPGDRVAGFLPNIPEAVIAMLGAASIGAIWSSCSPDFGAKAVLDRFGQIEPTVLVAADGYRYAGKDIDCRERVAAIAGALPSLRAVVVVPYRGGGAIPGARSWAEFTAAGRGAAPAYLRLPFDHPLYILYSSGTTGLPKCMVHGAGGTLVQHLKELVLHTDLRAGEPIFYFTTCGWMMWNWLVSALAVRATLVLYDGAPLAPPDILWRMAEAERVAVFGTSAKYLALLEKEVAARPAVRPGARDLAALRTVLSTGSPLAAHSYDFVARELGHRVQLSSISGGTDLVSCFALGNPCGPVYRGELQMRGLGMAVDVFDAAGRPLRREPGELVCTAPFPSMPVAFWGDPDGSRYRGAYFEHFPGVWRHGDWAALTARDGLVIYGRSDATLNPGGVRIGTAEIYRQVERLEEVVEALVVGQEWEEDVRIVLFVRLREGLALDEALRDRIRRVIREHASPHHVPRRIVQVAELPRTISGKITELAVREVIHGRPVANRDALANPAALDLFRDLPELAS